MQQRVEDASATHRAQTKSLREGKRSWVTVLFALMASAACGDTYHVWTGSATNGPGTAWSNAFWSIQGAVDVATNAGDMVLVTNGVYDTGGAVTPSYALSNRVCITNAIIVQSVNGPGHTLIVGVGPNGGGAMRCVYMTNGPTLTGFTLTNGHTRTSGDIICDQSGGGILATDGVVSNCIITASSAYVYGGGSGLGTLNACVLSGNAAIHGGGSYRGTLNNCTLSNNSASTYGGGALCENDGTLSNCTLSGNSAGYSGGGTYYGTLHNCALSGNSAQYGGGTDNGNLRGCTLSGNSASKHGGGIYNGELNNCALTGNTADSGGGAYSSTLRNCTLSGNSANTDGGGHYGSGLYNCISYYNKAQLGGDNGSGGSYTFCCTTPDPGGSGIITNAPMLLNAAHIYASSPCVAAGHASYASGVDIDGDAWANPPALGCDQPVGPHGGALTVSIEAPQTNIAVGCSLELHAMIGGNPSSNSWAFGDGDSRANSAYVWKSWSQTGVFAVACGAYNNDNPGGVSATTTIHVVETPVLYVWTNSPDPNPPYADWGHAAHTIQQAVDASAEVWGSLVVVTDGVYRAGGRVTAGYALSNRVVITHPVTVESVNGASSTFIVGESHPVTTNGNAAMRCVYMADGGHLHGFTLTNGHTRTSGDSIHDQSGGGALAGGVLSDCHIYGNSANRYGGGNCYGTLNDCDLSGNAASYNGGGNYFGTLNNCALSGNAATDGGGSYLGVLNNCTLSGNAATANGGGSNRGVLNNCALSGNAATDGGGSYLGVQNNCTISDNAAADQGGGSYGAALRNSIVYYNTAPTASSNYYSGTFVYSCTAPLPGGAGNVAGPPQFLDRAAANCRLAYGSPCTDRGNNTYAFGADDLDGLTRITDGNADGSSIVDMGAYEYDRSIYDTDGDGLHDGAELDTHGTDPLNPNTDGDPDSDGKEVTICDTDPSDPTSYFHILKIEATAHGIFDITLPCSTARSYYVEWGTNLLDWVIVPGMTNIPGDVSGFLSLTVTNDIGKAFFRGGVTVP